MLLAQQMGCDGGKQDGALQRSREGNSQNLLLAKWTGQKLLQDGPWLCWVELGTPQETPCPLVFQDQLGATWWGELMLLT